MENIWPLLEFTALLSLILTSILAYISSIVTSARVKNWPWFAAMLLVWPTFIVYMAFFYKDDAVNVGIENFNR